MMLLDGDGDGWVDGGTWNEFESPMNKSCYTYKLTLYVQYIRQTDSLLLLFITIMPAAWVEKEQETAGST